MPTLLRDPSKAANGLSPIFDKKKELEKLQEVQLIGEIGQQATQLVVSEKMGKAEKDARENKEYANSPEYKALQEKWGVGSDFQRGMQAATAALQGLAGGGLAEAAAGAASPYLAHMVKQQSEEGSASRILAHALTQGALAAAQNKNAMVGATGAATGELVGIIAAARYNKEVSQLSESEKETVSTLATLAAGLAGGLTGDSTASALAGAQTGKTVVENNYLSATEAERKTVLERREKAGVLTADEAKELAYTRKLDKDRDQTIHDICTQGNKSGGACSALVAQAQQALNTYGRNVSYNLIFKDLYPQDAANAGTILEGLDAGSITRDTAITAIAKAAGKSWDEVASQYDTVMQLHGAVSTLAGLKGVGAVVAEAAVVRLASGEKVTVITKGDVATVTYPDGINIKINLPSHLSNVEKYTQQKGITGGHNADAFFSTASKNNVKILGEKQTETKGVIEVQYKIPSYDREGNVTGYKDKVFTKTIYDPKIITDKKILDLGQQAASNGYKAAIAAGQREYTATAGGIKFQVYLDQKTGTVENFFPVAK
ncbi:hypothetical protein AOX56_21865 [Aeromonas sobria]|uniref:Uncharacterized protein n=1 Tax=Aeromonas sobria TaxID=646 RepID=A0A2N3INQ1_AERSO|nr:hypothetical protein AOX56_21865 [Aeromonas sobria]